MNGYYIVGRENGPTPTLPSREGVAKEYSKGEGVLCVQMNVELLRHSASLVLDDGLAVLLGGDKSPAVANIARPQCPL